MPTTIYDGVDAGGGGGTPSGPAGGDLAGTYPNPTVTSGAHHQHTIAQISDAGTTGQASMAATTPGAGRAAIGAGTSDLALGTTPTTAYPGDQGAAATTAAATAQSTANAALSAANGAQTTANAALPKVGGTMSGAIAMGGSKVTGAGAPTAAGDVFATPSGVTSEDLFVWEGGTLARKAIGVPGQALRVDGSTVLTWTTTFAQGLAAAAPAATQANEALWYYATDTQVPSIVARTGAATWQRFIVGAGATTAAARATLGRTIAPMTSTGWTSTVGTWTVTWVEGTSVTFSYAAGVVTGGAAVYRSDFIMDSSEYDFLVNCQFITANGAGNQVIYTGQDANNCLLYYVDATGVMNRGKIAAGAFTFLGFASGPTPTQLFNGLFWWRVTRREGVSTICWGVSASPNVLPTTWLTLAPYPAQFNANNADPYELTQGTYCRVGADANANAAGHVVKVTAMRTSVPGSPI